MATNLGEATVKVNFEMTDTAKQVLRSEVLKLLSEPDVLKALLEEIEKRLRMQTGIRQ